MDLPPGILRDQPLHDRTSFRIGGKARWFAEPGTREELLVALEWARAHGVPRFILGGGTNTLIADAGFSGLVVSMDALRGLSFDAGAAASAPAGNVTTLPGTPLKHVIHETMKWGLEGLERFVGIPGTIGGAVYGNAGGRGAEIRDYVASVTVYDDGEIITLNGGDLDWRYRSSGLGTRAILEVGLRLLPGQRKQVSQVAKELFNLKRASQPLQAWSAGCVFRNPPGEAAGELIERVGLKGARIGGAQVSDHHANFIVNDGEATAADVAALIARVQECVREQLGIELEHEIVVPDAGSEVAADEPEMSGQAVNKGQELHDA